MLNILCRPVGPLWTNCYIAWDTDSREGILIDPGDEGERLVDEVKKNGIRVRQIVLTHGHFDHIKEAARVSSELNAPVCAGKEDMPLIQHASEQAVFFGFRPITPPHIQSFLEHGNSLSVGSSVFRVISTPGHSPGSITLYSSSEGVAMVGDLIFFESVGRTDIAGGDYGTLLRSIQEHVLSMPDETRLLSGHGEETTVGHERLYNPFLTGVYRNEA